MAEVAKYILLDRDGVINRRIPNGYVTSWRQFEFLPRALDALRLLAETGYKTIVVSNQACVGRGLIGAAELEEINRRLVTEVEIHGGRIDAAYYCPHRKEEMCGCRKPSPGLLIKAQRDHGFVFEATFLVGDSEDDLLVARRVGCPMIRVADGATATAEPWSQHPQATVPDLNAAVRFILGQRRGVPDRDEPSSH